MDSLQKAIVLEDTAEKMMSKVESKAIDSLTSLTEGSADLDNL